MEPKGSSPYSQVPATCPYPEPTPSNPHNPLQRPEELYTSTVPKAFMTCRGQTSPFFSLFIRFLCLALWWQSDCRTQDWILHWKAHVTDLFTKFVGCWWQRIESADICTTPAQVIVGVEMSALSFLLVSIQVSSVVFSFVVRYCLRRVTPFFFVRHVKLV
jgi:ABC-type phosphate/phosphonate transport system permease subunit